MVPRKRHLIALGALMVIPLVAACQPESEKLPPVGESLVAVQKAQCEADGGTWGPGGKGSVFVCYRPTRDAGKLCRTSEDCSGFCLARSGTCAPISPLFGCNEVLNALGARTTVCVD